MKAIGAKWVLKAKRNAAGEVVKYKARPVATPPSPPPSVEQGTSAVHSGLPAAPQRPGGPLVVEWGYGATEVRAEPDSALGVSAVEGTHHWAVDSGATAHFCNDRSLFSTFGPITPSFKWRMATLAARPAGAPFLYRSHCLAAP